MSCEICEGLHTKGHERLLQFVKRLQCIMINPVFLSPIGCPQPLPITIWASVNFFVVVNILVPVLPA
jgi:hypothetical protein